MATQTSLVAQQVRINKFDRLIKMPERVRLK